MRKVIELLTQILQLLQGLFSPISSQNFSVKVDDKGNIIGYLRPDKAALYCSMSISHFKFLLSTEKIPCWRVSEKITLVRISDIDTYIEDMAKVNNNEN